MYKFLIYPIVFLLSFASFDSIAQDFSDIMFPFNQLKSIGLGDLNNDTYNDIIGIRTFQNKSEIYIYLRDSTTDIRFDGSLVTTTNEILGTPALGDIDNDGDVDAVFSTGGNKLMSMLMNNGNNSFSISSTNHTGTDHHLIGDINSDGYNDIVTYNTYPAKLRVFFGPTFNNMYESILQPPYTITDVSFETQENSSELNILTVLSSNTNSKILRYSYDDDDKLLMNTIFENPTDIKKIISLDVNNDQIKDFVYLSQNTIGVFVSNQSQMYFDIHIRDEFQHPYITFDTLDYNVDGTLDFVVSRLFAPTLIIKNIGTILNYSSETVLNGQYSSNMILSSDFDYDGDLDLVCTNGQLDVYENNTIIDKDLDGFHITHDCNDKNPNINPSSIEICDNIDNNCDNFIDENQTFTLYYRDFDNDGYGNYRDSILSCITNLPGYSKIKGDCNDFDVSINMNLIEVCDGKDNNCDGIVDENFQQYLYYLDEDEDGYGQSIITIYSCSTTAPVGYSSNAEDCDDNNRYVNYDSPEICDGVDNDCSGKIDDGFTLYTYYRDQDGDGYGDINNVGLSCLLAAPDGFVIIAGDCDDSDPQINPMMVETCDGFDNDCNGYIDDNIPTYIYYEDQDGDGYGTQNKILMSCKLTPPAGYVLFMNDCDDQNANINPGIMEICDNVDNNCNQMIDENYPIIFYYVDEDKDGFGSNITIKSCDTILQDGLSLNNLDCDDSNFLINPNGQDISGNGIDEDCSGTDFIANIDEYLYGISIEPNPATDYFMINSKNKSEKLHSVIYDLQGKKVLDCKDNKLISLKELYPGIFIVRVHLVENQTYINIKIVVL